MLNFLKNKKKPQNPELLKVITEDGIDHASDRFAEIIIQRYLSSRFVAYEFVLQELDGASYGSKEPLSFVKNSGVSASEYKGSLNKDTPYLDDAQAFINNLSFMLYPREDVSVPLRLAIVDKIMAYHQIGKYNF